MPQLYESSAPQLERETRREGAEGLPSAPTSCHWSSKVSSSCGSRDRMLLVAGDGNNYHDRSGSLLSALLPVGSSSGNFVLFRTLAGMLIDFFGAATPTTLLVFCYLHNSVTIRITLAFRAVMLSEHVV